MDEMLKNLKKEFKRHNKIVFMYLAIAKIIWWIPPLYRSAIRKAQKHHERCREILLEEADVLIAMIKPLV